MKNSMLLACLALLVAAPAQAAPAVVMSAAVKRDVQCFVLFSLAVSGAESANDQKMKDAGGLGLMYFLGKIRVAAPDLNFLEAVRQEANAMDAAPPPEEIGKDCDREFQQRGAELIELGRQLQQTSPQSSSSS